MKRTIELAAALDEAGRDSDNAVYLQYDLLELLDDVVLDDDRRAAVIWMILDAFARWPETDWGLPGPLVHWIEASELLRPLLLARLELEHLSGNGTAGAAPHLQMMANRQCNSGYPEYKPFAPRYW